MIEPRDLRRLRWYATALAGSIDDPDALGQVLAIQAELDKAITARVRELVAAECSWDDIARGAGKARQTVWRKYRDAADKTDAERRELAGVNQLD
jgi:DNA invertase Pin-like site-specific DNA recombinase